MVGAKSAKSIVSRLLRMPYKICQYHIFNDFISTLYGGKKIFSDRDTLVRVENKYDAIIVGSDQVWNDSITGASDEYYLPKLRNDTLKISYAASFGKKELSVYQKDCISRYLPSFLALSIREEDGCDDIKGIIKKDAQIVLDPVFLTSKQDWMVQCSKSRRKEPEEKYMLFYSLSFDPELIRFANKIAAEQNLKIYSIHPTAMKCRVNGTQLFNVGPYEFLSLIKNAEIVCTDSFHATAFSVIFEKKYGHIRKYDKESRVESLLHRLNAYKNAEKLNASNVIMDLSDVDKLNLDELVKNSKDFLLNALSRKSIN